MKIQNITMLLLAAAFTQVSSAQDLQVATLMHGDNTQVYEGSTGLEKAMEAAVSGDVITLSTGTFQGCTISKAVTIQGAGFVEEGNRNSTFISSSLYIQIPTEETGFTLEGVRSNDVVYVHDTLSYATFNACQFTSLSLDYAHTINCSFTNCRIDWFHADESSENLYVANSVVNYMYGAGESASRLIRNCLLVNPNGICGTYENNIILTYLSNSSIAARNNVYVDPWNLWNVGIDSNNYRIQGGIENIFVDPINKYSVTHPYTLAAESIATYIGTDGTQVGIHGGSRPYNDVPTNPQITQFEVAPQTNADGKLEVKITVSAQ